MDIKDATVEQLEAELAHRKAQAIEAQAETAKDEVQAVVDASAPLQDLGVVLSADAIDPDWVKITLGLNVSGYELAFNKGVLAQLVDVYKAVPTENADTVRVRKDRLIKHLDAINALLS